MKLIGQHRDYNLWMAEDGTIEAWASKHIIARYDNGSKVAKGIDRVILTARGHDDAVNELDTILTNRKKPKTQYYDPYKDPSQTRIE
jgi:hypothetical protein